MHASVGGVACRGVPGMNTVIIGALRALCGNAPKETRSWTRWIVPALGLPGTPQPPPHTSHGSQRAVVWWSRRREAEDGFGMPKCPRTTACRVLDAESCLTTQHLLRGGGDLIAAMETPPPFSDWANFSPGLRPIKNFLWRLRRKSV